MSKLSILYYSLVNFSNHGGSNHARQFLKHARQNPSVFVINIFPDFKHEPSKFKESPWKIFFRLRFFLIARFFNRQRHHYKDLIKVIEKHNPDVLIIRPDHNFLQIGALKRKFPSLLICVEINSSSFDESYKKIPFLDLFKKLEKRVYQNSDLNFFVSESLRDGILGREIDSKRDFIVYNGTDPEKFEKTQPSESYKTMLGILPNQLVIGYMGTLDFLKRIDLLIDSFARLKADHPNVFLLIIGDGPDRERAEHLIDFYKLRNSTLISGWIDYNQVTDYLFAVDIAVHHFANSYNCPLKIFDYLASGIPTVSPNIPFIKNNFINDYHLLITEPTPEAISSTIQKLIDYPELAQKISVQGKKHVLDNFTWKKNADFIVSKIYEKIDEKN